MIRRPVTGSGRSRSIGHVGVAIAVVHNRVAVIDAIVTDLGVRRNRRPEPALDPERLAAIHWARQVFRDKRKHCLLTIVRPPLYDDSQATAVC